jgi:hypothetical protein
MKRTLAMLALASAMILGSGCTSVTEGKIKAGGSWAKEYYNSANVAEIWTIENTNTNQVCEFTVKNFTRFTMNTPVPPKSVIPRDPTWGEGLFDMIKTVAPYAFMGYIFSGANLGGGTTASSTTINQAAAATAVTP